MTCASSGRDTLCHNPATTRLWCPTWLDADKGPRVFCDEHAKTFKRDTNPNLRPGSFHWGDDADKAFAKLERFISYRDETLYNNARGMVENGTPIYPDKEKTISRRGTYIVDGKLWLITYYHVSCLGDHVEARVVFPHLFEPTE